MRKCKFNMPEYQKIFDGNGGYLYTEKKDSWSEGFFHQWGHEYVEFETGPGNYTVGIVETADGKIFTPDPKNIVFLDPMQDDKCLSTTK
jgi:hypothetical protein